MKDILRNDKWFGEPILMVDWKIQPILMRKAGLSKILRSLNVILVISGFWISVLGEGAHNQMFWTGTSFIWVLKSNPNGNWGLNSRIQNYKTEKNLGTIIINQIRDTNVHLK